MTNQQHVGALLVHDARAATPEAAAAREASTGLGRSWSVVASVLLLGVAATLSDATVLRLWLVASAAVSCFWPSIASWRWGFGTAERTLLLAAVALLLLGLGTRDDLTRFLDQGKVRAWNVYHYYLGAKYFPELGYYDLYAASLVVDRQAKGQWNDVAKKARDLRTYEVVPRGEVERGFDPQQHFSPHRLAAFRQDLDALSRHRSPSAWKNVFRDRGYNGTPTWTALGRILSSMAPLDSWRLYILCSLDLVLLTATGILLWRTFGGGMSIGMLLLFVASPTNTQRLVGGFLQTDWLCAIALSLCFVKRARPALAAGCMAYAITTRLFPVLLVAAALVPLASTLLLRRRSRVGEQLPFARKYIFWLAGFCVAGVLLGGLGNGRGFGAWLEFREAISTHREIHRLGDRRIGLEHASTVPLSTVFTMTEDSLNDTTRLEHLQGQRALFALAASAIVLLVFIASRKRELLSAQALGGLLVFALLVSSRYYSAIFAFLPLAGLCERTQRYIVGGQVTCFAVYYAAVAQGAGWHRSYVLLNACLATYALAILIVLVKEKVPGRSRQRSSGRSIWPLLLERDSPNR